MVAGWLVALNDRLQRGSTRWRNRLPLSEGAELSLFGGGRIGMDRLSLWMAMRLSGLQDDAAVPAHAGWAGSGAYRPASVPSRILQPCWNVATLKLWSMMLNRWPMARTVGWT